MSAKRIRMFVFALLVAAVVGIVSSNAVCKFIDGRKENTARENYYSISLDNADAMFCISDSDALIFDEKAYDIFENNCLGNTNSALLSYGCYCKKGDLVCISENKTVLKANETETVISEQPSSYINIMGDYIYYRNDITRELCRYSISEKASECLVKSQCGEIVVSKKGISYLDMTTSKIKYMDFKGNKSTYVSDDEISSFAVIGDVYFCLKSNGDFGIVKKGGKIKLISSNVDRFYFDGGITLQKGNKIYLINGTEKTQIRELNNEGLLVGMCKDKIYILEGNNVNAYDAKTSTLDKTIVSVSSDEVVKGLYITKSTYEMLTYNKNAQLYNSPHYVTIKK